MFGREGEDLTRDRARGLVRVKAAHKGDLNRFSLEGERTECAEEGEREAKGGEERMQRHGEGGGLGASGKRKRAQKRNLSGAFERGVTLETARTQFVAELNLEGLHIGLWRDVTR